MGDVGPSFGGRIGSLRVPSESAPTGGSNRARRAGIRAEAQASALRRRLMNYFDVYISYSLWVGPHLSSHSYPGQPLGSARASSAAHSHWSHAQSVCGAVRVCIHVD